MLYVRDALQEARKTRMQYQVGSLVHLIPLIMSQATANLTAVE